MALDAAGTVRVSGGTRSFDSTLAEPFERCPGGADPDANAFVFVFAQVRPPVLLSTTRFDRPGKPFRVRVKGSSLEANARVYIGNAREPWRNTKGTETTLKRTGGDELATRLPSGTAVEIRVVNPDGGGALTVVRR